MTDHPEQYHGRIVVRLPSGDYGQIDMVAERGDLPAQVSGIGGHDGGRLRIRTQEDANVVEFMLDVARRVSSAPPGDWENPKTWFDRDRKVWAEVEERGIGFTCSWADVRGATFR